MNIIQAILLGLLQGLTEFIPVSSSGHLVVAHDILGLQKGGLGFDVALHIGTLLALVMFFSDEIFRYSHALVRKTKDSRLAWTLAFATLPAVVVGVLLQSAAESTFRSSRLVAIDLIVFGAIMLFAERYASKRKKRTKLENVSRNQALIMGLAQAAAIVPGVSRSGSTITAGLFAGLDRVAATRFSFLLAIPITFGAILKVMISDSGLETVGGQAGIYIAGIVAAFVSGLFAIRFLLRYLANHSLAAFAYYRFAFGAAILIMLMVR